MGLDGLDRQVEAAGHLLVGVPPGDEPQDVALAGGELVELGVGREGQRSGEGVEHEPGESRGEDGVTGGDPADGLDQLRSGDGLGQIAPGAGPDDGDDILGGIGNRWGVLPAALIVVLLPEKLQFIQEYRLLLYALLVIIILIARPDGLVARPVRKLRLAGRS